MALPFFWRQVLKRSTLLDIETTGLDPARHAPLGAAHGRFGGPIQETWFTYETAERTLDAPWYRKFGIKTEEAIEELMEPFAKREWEASWKKARADWLQRSGRAEPARKYFSKIIAREARAGRFLWTHNVRFDITQFGSQFAHPAAQKLMYEGAVVPGWTKWDPYSGRVYPTTTRTAHKMRTMLYDKPQLAPTAMRQWYGSYRQMVKEAVKTGKPAVLDSLAIAQSMMGMAQARGAMARTGDIFTGTSIEALATAFGVKSKARAHLAKTDVQTLERIMPKILETTEALYKGKQLKPWMASALRTLGEIQPEIAKRNVERMFAQATMELKETGKYRLRKGGYSRDPSDLIGVYKKFYKHRAYYEEGMLEETMAQVQGMSQSQLEHVLYTRAKVPEQIGKGAAFRVTKSRFGASMRRFLAQRNPYLLAGAAALAGLGAGALMLPDRKDHNTVEALRHEGLSSHTRRMMTDFGSGYNPRQVHPDILRFRRETWSDEAKRHQITDEIEKIQKAYQARLGRFRSSDLSRTDLSYVEGINQDRSDVREVNIRRFNVQVEDADTIFLERKGWLNWLKARAGYGRIAMRISGIDAPEIEHKDDPLVKKGLRWHAEQPYGKEATDVLKAMVEDRDIRVYTTKEPETYGRYIGVLADKSGRNINLDLIRQGAARALPWGKVDKQLLRMDMALEAEEEAQSEGVGMWGFARYREHSRQVEQQNRQITFNLLSRIDVLAGSSNLARLSTRMLEMNDTIEGMSENGLASYLRHMVSDFGSEYQGILAVSRWTARFGERQAAKYLTQVEVKDMMVYLRSQIKQSQLLRVGKSSFGLEMTPEVLVEHIATLRKLESAKGYKGGATLLHKEYFQGITSRRMRIDELKRAIDHEGFHGAAANQPILRKAIIDAPIPEEIQAALRVEGYNLSTGKSLYLEEGAKGIEEYRYSLREEAANFLTVPGAAVGTAEGIQYSVESALKNVEGEVWLEKLRSLHRQYMPTPKHVRSDAALRKSMRRNSMVKNIQEKHAPMGVPGVRLDHSPGVPGMLQRMHRNRSRSKQMYQR